MSLQQNCEAGVFRKISLYPDFKNGHKLQWGLDPAEELSPDFSFSVQTSELPTFDPLLETVNVDKNFFFIDDPKTKQNLSEDLFYRVVLTNDGKETISPSVKFGAVPEERRKMRMAAEIVRKEILRMQKYTGGKYWVLKRMHCGLVSEEHVDPISGFSIDDTTTHGTGFVGGYHPPLAIYCSVEDGGRSKEQGKLGIDEQYNLTLRTVGFPFLEFGDILVDDTNKRFHVQAAKDTFFPGTDIPIVQMLQTQLIPYSDTVYQIEVPFNG